MKMGLHETFHILPTNQFWNKIDIQTTYPCLDLISLDFLVRDPCVPVYTLDQAFEYKILMR